MRFSSLSSWYIVAALCAMVLVLGVMLWISDKRLDSCRTINATLEASFATAKNANKTNLKTIADCQRINAENAAQRENAASRAADAEARVAVLTQELIDANGGTFEPSDTNCRTLVEPLPADFACWLRGGAMCN